MLRTALAAIAVTSVAAGLVPAASATPDDVAGTPGPDAVAGCEQPLLRSARPAREVRRQQPHRFAAAARVNDRAVAELAQMSRDRSLWLDSCGRRLYVDRAPEGAAVTQPATGAVGVSVPGDVLSLSSKPGASRTLHLDFTGDVLQGTYWNEELGLGSIVMEPFSLDGAVDTAFSEDERRAIHEAWLVVAEDYAPFDVDVTTADPGPDALRRDSRSDQTYGSRVLVTNSGVVNDWCQGCGGVAVVDVFDLEGDDHDYTQPALVFADAVSGHGPWVGEAASHEVGHHLGLGHDGRATSPYYSGDGAWGPVMGAAYDRVLSQWSRGEYSGATNQQDDLAVIAARAPYRSDDHGDASAPTPLTPGGTATGLVGRTGDVDAFAFTAAGSTVLRAQPSSPFPNLDLGLTVLAEDGSVVARIDRPVTVGRYGTVSGLDAEWRVELAATPAEYVAVVDGVGAGDPASGGFSDYGSLGAYEVSLVTGAPSGPQTEPTADPAPVLTRALEIPATRLAAARVRARYQVRVSASGGSGGYHWRLRGELPRGLRSRVSADGADLLIQGRPTRRGRERFRVVVRDDAGEQVVRRYVIRVRPQA